MGPHLKTMHSQTLEFHVNKSSAKDGLDPKSLIS